MAEQSGFFPDVSGDRQYTADFLAQWIASVIGNGVYNGDLAVTAGGNMQINVPSGRAWINGYHYRNDGALLLNVANADGVLNRKDTVVLRWDINARSITAQILQGTPASNPVAPAIARSVDQFDLKLAEISIPAGTTAITQTLITDTRLDKAVCGIVTGVVQQVDTTTLYNQIAADLAEFKSGNEAGFTAWFNGIKDILDSSTAGNLLNLINTHKADETVHAVTLSCTKTGTVFALTGLTSASGIIPCMFRAPAAYAVGDAFTVGGTDYTVVTSDDEGLRTGAFQSGDVVGIHLDPAAQKLYIHQSNAPQVGALSNYLGEVPSGTSILTWCQQHTSGGCFNAVPGALNMPVSLYNVGFWTVYKGSDTANGTITLVTQDNDLYTNHCVNGNWSGWKESGSALSDNLTISKYGGNVTIQDANGAKTTLLNNTSTSADYGALLNHTDKNGTYTQIALSYGNASVATNGTPSLATPGLRNNVISSAAPSGGSDGDTWDQV